MKTNPMVKPRVATGPLLAATIIAGVCAVVTLAVFVLRTAPSVAWWMLLAIAICIVVPVGLRWAYVIRRKSLWAKAADEKWAEFAAAKQRLGATTEITVLAFHDVQPTGAWATIRWEQFGYVQQAWIEKGAFHLWLGSVLLIKPDPHQIQVGAPWPTIYQVHAADCLATAPTSESTP